MLKNSSVMTTVITWLQSTGAKYQHKLSSISLVCIGYDNIRVYTWTSTKFIGVEKLHRMWKATNFLFVQCFLCAVCCYATSSM